MMPSSKSVVYLSMPRHKEATAELTTQTSGDGGGSPAQYYVAEDYYQKYHDESSTAEPPTSTEQASTSIPSSMGDGDVQKHVDALTKLLLRSKANSARMFLIMFPLSSKSKQPDITTTPSPTTVRPKPRRKIKYIVVNN